MIVLHKVFHFCAAHRYWNEELSAAENHAAFGEDVRLHGHNYTLIVSVSGPVDERTGFVVDLGELKQLVNQRIIQRLDHSHIEVDIPWFQRRMPSTENLLRWIWEELRQATFSGKVVRLRLHETESIYTDLIPGADGSA